MKMSVEELIDFATKYYKDNNLEVPINVVSYISNYPKGLSRQVLSSSYGIRCSDFVKMLNPEYQKPMAVADRVKYEANRLRYEILTDISILTNNRSIVDLQCMDCGTQHTTSVTSMSGSLLGCPRCKSGNLPWNKRVPELSKLLLDKYEAEIVSEVPTSHAGRITVKHLPCGTEYSSVLVGLVHPATPLRGSCPNCRPSDRRVVFDGTTFGSQFELECYKLIKHLSPELHVEYKSYFDTDRRWVCDFKINDYWIEVSNFKTDYKNYFSNIDDKRALIESNGYHFFFVQSIKELTELVPLI